MCRNSLHTQYIKRKERPTLLEIHLSPEVAAAEFDSGAGGGGGVKWPIVMYMGLVVAAPYLMWKLVASVAGLEGGEADGSRETARGENEES